MTLSRIPAFTALLLSLALGSCARTETYGPYVYPIPGSGMTLISAKPGELVAIDPATGLAKWTHEFEVPPHPTYGAFVRPPLVCAVEQTTVGALVLAFEDRITTLDSRDGSLRWTVPFPGALEPVICPATTPDGGLVMAYDARYSSGVIAKYGPRGHRQWTYEPPDIGPLRMRLWADMETGNIHVFSRTHLLGLDPNGELNWSRRTTDIAPPSRPPNAR